MTPSHGGLGFSHDFGGNQGFLAAQFGDRTGTETTGGLTGDPGAGGICGGALGGRSGGPTCGTTSAVVSHFDLRTELDPHTGEATRLAVVALDASNHPVWNYTGTVHLTDTDSATTLPADYKFTASDHGRHSFQITPATNGSQTITATDTANANVTGTIILSVTPAPAATHFRVLSRRDAATGAATDVLVIALDASNHPVRNYTGTVHLTSSDTAAGLPADFTFTAADHGVHDFSVTLNTIGSQTVTATDMADSTITASVTVTVGTTTGGGGGLGGWGHHHHHWKS